jgi:hypothetical protein
VVSFAGGGSGVALAGGGAGSLVPQPVMKRPRSNNPLATGRRQRDQSAKTRIIIVLLPLLMAEPAEPWDWVLSEPGSEERGYPGHDTEGDSPLSTRTEREIQRNV